MWRASTHETLMPYATCWPTTFGLTWLIGCARGERPRSATTFIGIRARPTGGVSWGSWTDVRQSSWSIPRTSPGGPIVLRPPGLGRGRVVTIRDFRFARYALDGADMKSLG